MRSNLVRRGRQIQDCKSSARDSTFEGSKRESNIPPIANQSILPRHRLRRNNTLAPRNQPPTTRSKRAIQYPPVLDLRQIQDTIRLNLDLIGLRRGEEDISGFFRKGRRAESVERARPVNLLLRRRFELQWLVRKAGFGDVGSCGLVGGWGDDAGGAVCC